MSCKGDTNAAEHRCSQRPVLRPMLYFIQQVQLPVHRRYEAQGAAAGKSVGMPEELETNCS